VLSRSLAAPQAAAVWLPQQLQISASGLVRSKTAPSCPTSEPGRAPAPAAALESALTVCTNVPIPSLAAQQAGRWKALQALRSLDSSRRGVRRLPRGEQH